MRAIADPILIPAPTPVSFDLVPGASGYPPVFVVVVCWPK